jgi:hypothetical protein
MQFFHKPAVVSASFDEANLVSSAGLLPVMTLARDAVLQELADESSKLITFHNGRWPYFRLVSVTRVACSSLVGTQRTPRHHDTRRGNLVGSPDRKATAAAGAQAISLNGRDQGAMSPSWEVHISRPPAPAWAKPI